MASYLRDIRTNATTAEAVQVRTVTTTTTGPAADMVAGDGRCTLVVQYDAATVTAGTVRVTQCAASTGTYTDVTGATVGITTGTGLGSVGFDRGERYLQAVVVLTAGSTIPMSALFFEQTKVV